MVQFHHSYLSSQLPFFITVFFSFTFAFTCYVLIPSIIHLIRSQSSIYQFFQLLTLSFVRCRMSSVTPYLKLPLIWTITSIRSISSFVFYYFSIIFNSNVIEKASFTLSCLIYISKRKVIILISLNQQFFLSSSKN